MKPSTKFHPLVMLLLVKEEKGLRDQLVELMLTRKTNNLPAERGDCTLKITALEPKHVTKAHERIAEKYSKQLEELYTSQVAGDEAMEIRYNTCLLYTHNPQDWESRCGGKNGACTVVAGSGDLVLADVRRYADLLECRTEANARLMAAGKGMFRTLDDAYEPLKRMLTVAKLMGDKEAYKAMRSLLQEYAATCGYELTMDPEVEIPEIHI